MSAIIECPDAASVISDTANWPLSTSLISGFTRKKFFGTEKDILHVVTLPERVRKIGDSTCTTPSSTYAHFEFDCPENPRIKENRQAGIYGIITNIVDRDTNEELVFFGSYRV